MNNTPLKCCSRNENCTHPMGCWQPATSEYFSKHSQCKDGLRPYCKHCQKMDAQNYYTKHKTEIIRNATQYNKDHPEQVQERNRRFEERNKDKRRIQRKHNYHANPQHHLDRSKKWRLNNLEKVRQQERERRKKNRPHINELARKRRQSNPQKRRDYEREYRVNNPAKVKALNHRHLSRKRNLPSDFTDVDWNNAIDYFHGCCAVCGRQLNDLFATHKAAADHWIPLTSPDCPGTIRTNIVPLCHGTGGCNNIKSDRNAIEFLETEFGKRKAKKINAKVEAYFEWVKSQP